MGSPVLHFETRRHGHREQRHQRRHRPGRGAPRSPSTLRSTTHGNLARRPHLRIDDGGDLDRFAPSGRSYHCADQPVHASPTGRGAGPPAVKPTRSTHRVAGTAGGGPAQDRLLPHTVDTAARSAMPWRSGRTPPCEALAPTAHRTSSDGGQPRPRRAPWRSSPERYGPSPTACQPPPGACAG